MHVAKQYYICLTKQTFNSRGQKQIERPQHLKDPIIIPQAEDSWPLDVLQFFSKSDGGGGEFTVIISLILGIHNITQFEWLQNVNINVGEAF